MTRAVRINRDRLWASLMELKQIGAYHDQATGLPGVRRLALTDADAEARRRCVDWMLGAGLEVRVDRIGNVYATRPGRDRSLPCVLMGSHIDTVATGGAFDGTLGVLGGIEVMRTLDDAGIATLRDIEVGFFTEEEGVRFGTDMLGADAILVAGHHLAALDHLDRQLRGRPHPFLGPGNLHASLISGGTSESTIPDRCVFTIERRTLPGETLGHLEADIAELIERCRPADPRITVSARTVLHRPPMQTPPDAPIVRALLDAAGPGTSVAPMSYWADSAFLAQAGIPTVLYGPEGDGAHADTEWVSRSGTTTAATVLTRLAQDFCS
jgi:acetylornithine deacetylase/succinyl-diaminopimelate desuccinylase-like protein